MDDELSFEATLFPESHSDSGDDGSSSPPATPATQSPNGRNGRIGARAADPITCATSHHMMAQSAPLGSIESLTASPKSGPKKFRARKSSRAGELDRVGPVVSVGDIAPGHHEAVHEVIMQELGPSVKTVHLRSDQDFGFIEFQHADDAAKACPLLRARLEGMNVMRCQAVSELDPRLGDPCDTLMVRNVPVSLNESDIRALLDQEGIHVVDVKLKLQTPANTFQGMIFLTFGSVDAAVQATHTLKSRDIFKRKLKFEFKRLAQPLMNKLEAFKSGPDAMILFSDLSRQDRDTLYTAAHKLGLLPSPLDASSATSLHVWKPVSRAPLTPVHVHPPRATSGHRPGTSFCSSSSISSSSSTSNSSNHGALSASLGGPSEQPRQRGRSLTLSSLRSPRGPDGTRGFAPRTPVPDMCADACSHH